MQSVAVAAARKNTSGKVVYNQNLVIFDDVIMVLLEQIMRLQGKVDVVLNLKVLGIGEVLNLEELLDLMNALLGQVDRALLLVDTKSPVSCVCSPSSMSILLSSVSVPFVSCLARMSQTS